MKQIVLVAALGLSACITPGKSATPGLGETGLVGGLRLRPIEIVEDSRCPALVRCVWEGRLVVRTEIRGPGWTQVRELELGIPQAVGENRVALISAHPAKATPGSIPPAAYRFTFAVSGR